MVRALSERRTRRAVDCERPELSGTRAGIEATKTAKGKEHKPITSKLPAGRSLPVNKAFIIVLACLWLAETSFAQEWPYYGGDAGGMRYSPLAQINRSNVKQLQVAWTYHTGDLSDGSKYPTLSAFECTPLVVDGTMYLTTPFSRVIALEAETGKERWAFDPKLDKNKPNNLFINRGVAFARLGKEERIFLGTLDGRLFALDARNGQPVKSFGQGGFIDLRVGVADKFPNRHYGMTSPPVVYKNLVICGSLVPDGEPQGPSGDVRAFDARTGKLVWTFHTVPHRGEYGNDTWEGDSWQDRAAVNPWSLLSVDSER